MFGLLGIEITILWLITSWLSFHLILRSMQWRMMLSVLLIVIREVLLVCLQFFEVVPFLGPLYHQTMSQQHIVSVRRAPWLSVPFVDHFLTLILSILGISEFLSRLYLWIFAMQDIQFELDCKFKLIVSYLFACKSMYSYLLV